MKTLATGIIFVLLFLGISCENDEKTRKCRGLDHKSCVKDICGGITNFVKCEKVTGQEKPNCICNGKKFMS